MTKEFFVLFLNLCFIPIDNINISMFDFKFVKIISLKSIIVVSKILSVLELSDSITILSLKIKNFKKYAYNS